MWCMRGLGLASSPSAITSWRTQTRPCSLFYSWKRAGGARRLLSVTCSAQPTATLFGTLA
jgi:hypothetical protein